MEAIVQQVRSTLVFAVKTLTPIPSLLTVSGHLRQKTVSCLVVADRAFAFPAWLFKLAGCFSSAGLGAAGWAGRGATYGCGRTQGCAAAYGVGAAAAG